METNQTIDMLDDEYTIPGELLRTAYDTRTGPEKLQRRIEELERRVTALEQMHQKTGIERKGRDT